MWDSTPNLLNSVSGTQSLVTQPTTKLWVSLLDYIVQQKEEKFIITVSL